MKFEIPEDLKALSAADLAKAIAEGRKFGLSLIDGEAPTAEDIKFAGDIQAFIESANAEVAAREAEAARLSAMRESFAAEDEADEETEDETEETPEAEAEEETEVEEVETPEAEAEEEPEVVAASGKKETFSQRAAKSTRKGPGAPEPEAKHGKIFASADVSGFATGAEMTSLDQVGQAAHSRFSKMQGAGQSKLRLGVATFDLSDIRTGHRSIDGLSGEDAYALIESVIEEKSAPGALVAAGGWGAAPAETLYGLPMEAVAEGLVDLPTVQASRGKVQFSKGFDIGDFMADADLDWDYTEAQVIAETEKPLTDITDPTFTTETLRAMGIAIRSPLLTAAAYPEQVTSFVEHALVAHAAKQSAREYAVIEAGSTGVSLAGAVTSTDAVARLGMVADYERQKRMLPKSTVFEVNLPEFMEAAIKADLGRQANIPAESVTSAMVNSIFSVWNLAPNFLRETGQGYTEGTPAGGYTPLTLPTLATVTMYPTGTWVKFTKDIISMDAVYDSTLLKVNKHLALFTEEGWAVSNFRGRSLKVQMPVIASGQTGAADLNASIIATA